MYIPVKRELARTVIGERCAGSGLRVEGFELRSENHERQVARGNEATSTEFNE